MEPKAIIDNFLAILRDHYFDMRGRVGRASFWYFVLAAAIVEILAGMVQAMTFFLLPLGFLVWLALLAPLTGLGARRLQDTGRDGRLVWALIVPNLILLLAGISAFGPFGFIGFLAFQATFGVLLRLVALAAALMLLWYWIQPGDPGDNAYGPPPPA